MLINSIGDKETLIIRRLRCEGCRRIHHELPDIVVPYKRHCMDSIEKIIAGKTMDVYIENSAIRRIKAWWASCRLYFGSVLSSLREKYGAVFPEKPAPREIVRAVVNAHLWISTRSVCMTG